MLSGAGSVAFDAATTGILRTPGFYHPLRPNTPVLPYATTSSNSPTFVDPSVRILQGNRIAVSVKTFIAPYATLDATGGFIKIGNTCAVQDNALIQANPNHLPNNPGILLGDSVAIGFNAQILGPSIIGAGGSAAKPTYIGPNARIEPTATVSPGAFVSGLARIGPGVVVPSGVMVLPGANVTTTAEATNPALGKVVPISSSSQAFITQTLSNSVLLAVGYSSLYQGSSATGVSPGVPSTVAGIFNGNLAAVTGVSQEPGTTTVPFEPKAQSPQFPSQFIGPVQVLLPLYRARLTGQVLVSQRANQFEARLGRSVSIRGDEGQPISISSIAQLGNAVSMHALIGGSLSIGTGLRAGSAAVVVGGTGSVIGSQVTIGPSAVVQQSSIGSGSLIGSRSYIAGSTLPANSLIPPGTIMINNQIVGHIQW